MHLIQYSAWHVNKRGNVDQKLNLAIYQSYVLIGAQTVNNCLECMLCASQPPTIVCWDVAGTGKR